MVNLNTHLWNSYWKLWLSIYEYGGSSECRYYVMWNGYPPGWHYKNYVFSASFNQQENYLSNLSLARCSSLKQKKQAMDEVSTPNGCRDIQILVIFTHKSVPDLWPDAKMTKSNIQNLIFSAMKIRIWRLCIWHAFSFMITLVLAVRKSWKNIVTCNLV